VLPYPYCLSVFATTTNHHHRTGVRDYIHVMDLSQGHLDAISYATTHPQYKVFNLGTGNGYSVLDMVKAMAVSCGHDIAYKIVARRPGDIAVCYADAALAKKELGWEATLSLQDMCTDLWSWQSKNPDGYPKEEE
jgi:UDP-glucose 4-epimerase